MTPESNDRTDDPAATEGTSSEYLVYAQVAEAVDVCIREGHAPDVDALVAEHPEQAAHIRELVPTLVTLHDLGHEAKVVQDRTSASDSSEGTARQLGDYRIIREIGRGGMGVVYEAEQVSLGRRVALKVLPFAAVLDQRQLQRFKKEAQAAAQLHHTNIVPVFAVGCERGVHYYAMQYIEGQTLAAAIAELRQIAGVAGTPRGSATSSASSNVRLVDTPLTAPGSSGPLSAICSDGSTQNAAFFHAVAGLGVEAAEALEHAHASGIVHRDIKPSNLLLDARGKIWIADFGLAHVQSDPCLTITGDLLGTIRYMSPEQALAKRALVDHRTDVYSLGVTLYELLTLEPAIVGEDRQELLLKIAGEDPRPPRNINAAIPRDLETIILKAIGKTPEERYARARDLADDLRNYLQSKPIKAKRPTLLDRAMKWSRRHRTVVASAVALLVLVSVGLTVSTILIWKERAQTQFALQRSETNVAIALDVLDQIYLQIAEQHLPRDSGLTDRDRVILVQALQFYSQFADANAADDAVGVEVVQAFLRVGAIQYQLSRPEDAEATYRQTIDLIGQLDAARGQTVESRRLLARAYGELGKVLNDLGRHEEQKEACRTAISIREALVAEHPGSPEDWLQLALHFDALASAYMYGEDYTEAEALYREVVSIHERIATEFSPSRKYQTQWGRAVLALAKCLQYTQTSAAEDHYRDAIRMLGALTDDSGRLHAERLLAAAHHSLATMLDRHSRLREADESVQKAIELQWNVVRRFPGVVDCLRRAATYEKTAARIANHDGRPDEAESILRRVHSTLRALSEQYSKSRVFRTEFASAANDLAWVLVKQNGGQEEAIKIMRETVDYTTGLLDRTPENTVFRSELAYRTRALANIAGKAMRWEESAKYYQEAVAEYERLAEQAPLNHRYRREVAVTLEWFGGSSGLNTRFDEAEAAYRRALSMSEALAKEVPGDAVYRIAVGIIQLKLANLFWQMDRFEEASATFDRALRAEKEAVSAFPGWGGLQRDLRQCRLRVAWFLVSCPEAAIRDPRRALELAEMAVAEEPQSRSAQLTLGAALYRTGDYAGSIEALQKAWQFGSGSPNSRAWLFLAMAHRRLGEAEVAREWFRKAVKWIDENRPDDKERRRLRSEAEELLGLKAPASTETSSEGG